MLANALTEDAARAEAFFARERYDSAAWLVTRIVDDCTGCHSRQAAGDALRMRHATDSAAALVSALVANANKEEDRGRADGLGGKRMASLSSAAADMVRLSLSARAAIAALKENPGDKGKNAELIGVLGEMKENLASKHGAEKKGGIASIAARLRAFH